MDNQSHSAPSSDQLHAAVRQLRDACERLAEVDSTIGEDEDYFGTLLLDADGKDAFDVIGAAVRAIGEAEGNAAAVKQREEALYLRRQRFEQQAAVLREGVLAAMQTLDRDKLKLPDATLSVRPSRGRVLITDATLLPAEFVEFVHKPRTAEIGLALRDGTAVPGAELSNLQPVLTVRTQ
jgi:hypothetical protein